MGVHRVCFSSFRLAKSSPQAGMAREKNFPILCNPPLVAHPTWRALRLFPAEPELATDSHDQQGSIAGRRHEPRCRPDRRRRIDRGRGGLARERQGRRFDAALGRWVQNWKPLGQVRGGGSVAAVPAVGTSGSIVVTKARAAVNPPRRWCRGRHHAVFGSCRLPLRGRVVRAAGGGYVYQRSTIQDPNGPFPYGDGPTTPAVFLASNRGSQLIVQGFTATNTPSTDTYTEPLWGPVGTGFTPLQPRSDPAATGISADATLAQSISSNLVVYPQQLKYNSPSIVLTLPGHPQGAVAGLYGFSPLPSGRGAGGGSAQVPNTPPTLPQSNVATWARAASTGRLREQRSASTTQHHYVANWLHDQGSVWNLTFTVASRARGSTAPTSPPGLTPMRWGSL